MDRDRHYNREMAISLYKNAARLAGSGRRFKALLKPSQVLSGKDLAREMAAEFYNGNEAQAQYAILAITGLIERKLAEGCQLDFEFASFYPKLSAGLTARDIDPNEDGVYVQGAVKARAPLRNLLRDKILAYNPLCKNPTRIYGVGSELQQGEVIVPEVKITVSGNEILVLPDRADEGFYLEKRSSKRANRGLWIPVAKAEVLRSDANSAEMIFHGDLGKGNDYRLVVATRNGKSLDYAVRRVGHAVWARRN